MKTKLVDKVWHIYLNNKWIKMNPHQLHNKIQTLIKESKADKILIKAQIEIINDI